MVATPWSSASRGESKSTGRPARRTAPAVGRWTPATTLTSVDLPAPLSPQRARTSPSRTARETSLSASTAPKRIESRWTSRRGAPSLPGDIGGVDQHGLHEQEGALDHVRPLQLLDDDLLHGVRS